MIISTFTEIDYQRQPHPGYTPYEGFYHPPYETPIEQETLPYDPTQPPVHYGGPMMQHQEFAAKPPVKVPVSAPAGYNYQEPTSYYPQQNYQEPILAYNRLASDLDLGGNSSQLGSRNNFEKLEIKKKEENSVSYVNNPGFAQALGLAPQPEEEIEGLDSKGKIGIDSPDDGAKPFSNF
jgi:hypothetical protein